MFQVVGSGPCASELVGSTCFRRTGLFVVAGVLLIICVLDVILGRRLLRDILPRLRRHSRNVA